MGAALGILHSSAKSVDALRPEFQEICDTLAKTRPTAVDLFWALDRMKRRFAELTSQTSDLVKIRQGMVEEAQQIHLEKKATDEAIGRFGAEFMPSDGRVNDPVQTPARSPPPASAPLSASSASHSNKGKSSMFLVPRNAAHISRARASPPGNSNKGGIPLTLITDNMVGHFLKTEKVSAIVTGADRIAAMRHRHKIGTYQIAVLAKENNVPFYIAAPVSTFDLSIPDGDHIPIEERSAAEVTHLRGVRIAPDVHAAHPAFDVTPARYIAAIFTETRASPAPPTRNLSAPFLPLLNLPSPLVSHRKISLVTSTPAAVRINTGIMFLDAFLDSLARTCFLAGLRLSLDSPAPLFTPALLERRPPRLGGQSCGPRDHQALCGGRQPRVFRHNFRNGPIRFPCVRSGQLHAHG